MQDIAIARSIFPVFFQISPICFAFCQLCFDNLVACVTLQKLPDFLFEKIITKWQKAKPNGDI